MPDATVSTDTERKDLESLPGGYVEVKPLPYGGVLTRRESAMKMSMEQTGGNRAARRRRAQDGKDDSGKIDVELLQRWARAYEFKHCIVDHNLETRDGQKLDFGNPMTLDVLNPKVGVEIERILDEINGEDTEEELENFIKSATTSSEEQEPKPTS
jgi:hypothetical protein